MPLAEKALPARWAAAEPAPCGPTRAMAAKCSATSSPRADGDAINVTITSSRWN